MKRWIKWIVLGVPVTSDSGNRDNQFRGRIMDVATHPTATFRLTEPIDFGAVPDAEAPVTATATGDLTLRGSTNSVTFEVQARLIRSTIEALGDIPIVFADYGIPNPSGGPARVSDEGTLEFLLVFEPG
jgi:polyisoprenoid-binding protein YceI